MNKILAEGFLKYLDSYVTWIVILILVVVTFFVVFHYAKRYFTHKTIVEIYFDGKKRIKKYKHYKIGSTIDTKNLKIKKKYPQLKIESITSQADIEEGDIRSFKMPKGDVLVTYVKASEPIKEGHLYTSQVLLPLGKRFALANDEVVKPVNILDLTDIINHIQKSNTDTSNFPLINRYKGRTFSDRNVLVLYCGETIYSLVIEQGGVYKFLFRLDASYAKKELSHLPSISALEEDIYSFIFDMEYMNYDELTQVLDYSYSYVYKLTYKLEGASYIYNKEEVERKNSLILHYIDALVIELDPLYDRKILEARKYKESLIEAYKKENELDKAFYAPRDLVYSDLKKFDDSFLGRFFEDEFKIIPDYKDDVFVEEEVKVEKKKTLPTIEEELADLTPITPSELDLDTFIKYIMDRKDMVSLTIKLTKDISKSPVRMLYLNHTFCLVNKGKFALNFNLRLSQEEADKVAKKHSSMKHILVNNQSDWYKIGLDKSFKDYQELYELVLISYDYSKRVFYSENDSLSDTTSMI